MEKKLEPTISIKLWNKKLLSRIKSIDNFNSSN